jgi:CRP/FNR family transcriptional regulator
MKRDKKIMINPQCEMCSSLDLGLFGDLEFLEIRSLASQKSTRYLKKGQMLFEEGAPSAGLHCISSGSIKVTMSGTQGKETVLNIANAGDVLGYRGVLTGENSATSATAIKDSVVCCFDKELINQALRRQPSIAIKLIQLTGESLKFAEARIVSMAERNAFERTVELLLLLKESHGIQSDGNQWKIDLRLKREELASMAGVSMVTLIRSLSELKSEGVIAEVDKAITIIDEKRLLQLANLS